MKTITYKEIVKMQEIYKNRIDKIADIYNSIITKYEFDKNIMLDFSSYSGDKDDFEHKINPLSICFEFEYFLYLLRSIEQDEFLIITTNDSYYCRGYENIVINKYKLPVSIFKEIENDNYDFNKELEDYLLSEYRKMEKYNSDKHRELQYIKEIKEKELKDAKYQEYLKLKKEFES